MARARARPARDPRRRPADPLRAPAGTERSSEAEIAVHWKEEATIPPPRSFAAQANLTDPTIAERFGLEHFPDCYREYADLLDWERPWTEVLDDRRAPFYRWFVGGRLNAAVNCVDRHLASRRDQPAFLFVPESETEPVEAITYQQLSDRVHEVAAILRDEAGVRPGDRVTLHLPMTPALPITMLACARLGAVHTVVFGGFSGEACGRRIADSGSRVLVTMDAAWRNGTLQDHRASADVAVATAAREGGSVDRVLVWQREPGQYRSRAPMVEGRDALVADLLPTVRGTRVEAVPMPSDAPLFLMYTSGTTGRPKGVQHGTGGYLSYAAATARMILDLHPTDVYWCLADIGWITGHSYIVYGPLALGATSVLYEGAPTHPDAGRPWRVAERLGVTIFHTSPTLIRQLRKLDPTAPTRSRTAFRLLVTVGEPIEPETWRWYHDTVGNGKAVVADTWWQTETGGFLASTKPALDRMKPGSTGPPLPGIHPVIYDDDGAEVPLGSGRAGTVCVTAPWPGLMQTIWNDPDRYVREYFARFNRRPESRDWRDWPYVTGDAAVRAADGYLRILGRIDDVINVAGHRLGTKELESACLGVPQVAEAAVVPVADEVKGRLPEVYVALRPGARPVEGIEERVVREIERTIGKIARPRAVWVVPDMPKTRSGKIMRRVLAAISNHREVGDVTTLANPEAVEQIRRIVHGRTPGPTRKGPDDLARSGTVP